MRILKLFPLSSQSRKKRKKGKKKRKKTRSELAATKNIPNQQYSKSVHKACVIFCSCTCNRAETKNTNGQNLPYHSPPPMKEPTVLVCQRSLAKAHRFTNILCTRKNSWTVEERPYLGERSPPCNPVTAPTHTLSRLKSCTQKHANIQPTSTETLNSSAWLFHHSRLFGKIQLHVCSRLFRKLKKYKYTCVGDYLEKNYFFTKNTSTCV